MRKLKDKMLDTYRNDPSVHAHFQRYLMGHLEYETALENCVIDLVANKKELTNQLLDMYARQPLRSLGVSCVTIDAKNLIKSLTDQIRHMKAWSDERDTTIKKLDDELDRLKWVNVGCQSANTKLDDQITQLKQQLADRDTADGLLKSQAEAWATVCKALNEHCPGWAKADGVPPIDAAVNAIKSIDTSAVNDAKQYRIIVDMLTQHYTWYMTGAFASKELVRRTIKTLLTYDTERRNKFSETLKSITGGFSGEGYTKAATAADECAERMLKMSHVMFNSTPTGEDKFAKAFSKLVADIGVKPCDPHQFTRGFDQPTTGMLMDGGDFGFMGWSPPNEGEATPLGQPRNRTFNFKQMIGRALRTKPEDALHIKVTLSSPYGNLPINFDTHVKVDNSTFAGQHGMTFDDIDKFSDWLVSGTVRRYKIYTVQNMFVIDRSDKDYDLTYVEVKNHLNQWLNSTGKKERYTVTVSGDQMVISRVITHTMPE